MCRRVLLGRDRGSQELQPYPFAGDERLETDEGITGRMQGKCYLRFIMFSFRWTGAPACSRFWSLAGSLRRPAWIIRMVDDPHECGEDEHRSIKRASGTPRIPRTPSCSHPSPLHILNPLGVFSAATLPWKDRLFPAPIRDPTPTKRVSWLTSYDRPILAHASTNDINWVIIGRFGIQYPGSWRGHY